MDRLNAGQFTSTPADFGAKVGSGIGKTGILPVDTKVIAIGSGSTSYEFYDPTFNSGIGTIASESRNRDDISFKFCCDWFDKSWFI